MVVLPVIVRTRSLRGGHYRAGLKHGAEPGDIPPGTVTEDQLAVLRADPDLEVEIIDPPQEPPQPRKKKPAPAAEGTGAPAAGPAEAAEAADGDAGDEDFGFDDDPAPGAEGK